MNKLQKRMFSELLMWGSITTEDEKGYVLNKFAIQLATYFLCELTREELTNKSNVNTQYETLAAVGHHFSNFANWQEDAAPNRVKEALDSLEYIGFLSVTKVDATSDQRDNYGYRDKSILLIELKLETFGLTN